MTGFNESYIQERFCIATGKNIVVKVYTDGKENCLICLNDIHCNGQKNCILTP